MSDQPHPPDDNDALRAGTLPFDPAEGAIPITAARSKRRGRSAPLPAPADGRPRLYIGPDEARVVSEAISALGRDPDLYVRGGMLVRVLASDLERRAVLVREPDAPRIEPLPVSSLQPALSEVAEWARPDGDEVVRVHPPAWAVAAVASAGEWPGVRPLLAVIESPTLRPDGTILDAPGYDAATGLLLRPVGPVDPIPESPTAADAARARDMLLEVVEDFPLEAPHHRAAWLAAVLTALGRWALAGPMPLILIDGNVRGCGKGLLAQTVGIIASGRALPVMTWPADESERRKVITSLALAGDPLILIDNVEGTLGGAALNAALTSTVWTDRILGLSRTTGRLPMRAVWFATGNNCDLGADTARRVIHVRLASPLERPEDRRDYRHPDRVGTALLGWIRAERPRLVAAALTILRGYFVAGQPDTGLTPLGSYEGWSAIRGAVTWVGLPDPAATQRALATRSDRDGAELRGLINGLDELAAGEWLTVGEILRRVGGGCESAATLRAVLLEHCGDRGELPSARRLAGRLRRYLGRVVDGRRIVNRDARSGLVAWCVERVV